MSKIKFNRSETFKALLPQLIDYAGCTDYLWSLPFQTIQMANTQTLRVEDASQSIENIVFIGDYHCSFTDNDYYKNYASRKERERPHGWWPRCILPTPL